MRITVKLFAILRERAGTAELQLDIPGGSAASAAMESIANRHPSLRELLARTAIAINQHYADRETRLNDGDELALIPPVSGG